jgi:hypothetical protein
MRAACEILVALLFLHMGADAPTECAGQQETSGGGQIRNMDVFAMTCCPLRLLSVELAPPKRKKQVVARIVQAVRSCEVWESRGWHRSRGGDAASRSELTVTAGTRSRDDLREVLVSALTKYLRPKGEQSVSTVCARPESEIGGALRQNAPAAEAALRRTLYAEECGGGRRGTRRCQWRRRNAVLPVPGHCARQTASESRKARRQPVYYAEHPARR